MVVTENPEWFPLSNEFEKRNTLLGNPSVLLRQCEIYARGHDITWSFNYPMFDAPWSSFYFFAELDTLSASLRFLEVCHKKGLALFHKTQSRTLSDIPLSASRCDL